MFQCAFKLFFDTFNVTPIIPISLAITFALSGGNYSSLWSDIDISRGQVAKVMFQRSKNAAIKVHGHFSQAQAPEATQLLSSHLPRICFLKIQSGRVNPPSLKELLHVLQSLAASLHTLSLIDGLPISNTKENVELQFPVVELSRIEELKITGPMVACIPLLIHLRHPHGTEITIHGKIASGRDDLIVSSSFLSHVAKYFHVDPNSRSSGVQKACFDWMSDYSDPSEEKDPCYMGIDIYDQHGFMFRVHVEAHCPDRPHEFRWLILERGFSAFFDTFNVSQLSTVLFWGGFFPVSPTVLHNCCGALPNLKTFHVDI
ncbi:hypothetical protein NP233_g5170 [Leucocoprinus birnbaumii]|uniref:Uncharacterized protein n=1 Tax=Leucocoprinus birnbaumii TaxID=56174 RepID=A0AAD5VTE2_9AGAR|nr:hypothetical protein NP233_g5170 [Leucocoprinus birnbaumii]